MFYFTFPFQEFANKIIKIFCTFIIFFVMFKKIRIFFIITNRNILTDKIK